MTCLGRRRSCAVVAVIACVAGAACGREEPAATTPVQLVAGPSATASGPGTAGDASGVIAFPPRNEPFAFREELERKYRDGLRRSPSSTYVDLEGDIVWTQEYLRYRVNECSHDVAVQRVLAQIDGQGILPVCGNPPPRVVPFPPRNEPYAFRQELERKYRDGLRRNATSSYVDIEGSIVWTQEYLRYRVNRCGHEVATQKVLDQIDGKGIAPVCTDGPTGIWDGTSSFFNAPFTIDMWVNGTSLAGRYADRHDVGYVWGTYTGGPAIVVNVNFGDGGIRLDGTFDGPDRITGTMRVFSISGTFPFTMIRRP
ncbi:MAG: hypothetical protein MUE61_14805 [Vicinamibacterales bacterium]|jgi:hypothetical protein|nr:hypothetical protein [Vicinamibacterales bacterium]